jgi:hypothetical protein
MSSAPARALNERLQVTSGDEALMVFALGLAVLGLFGRLRQVVVVDDGSVLMRAHFILAKVAGEVAQGWLVLRGGGKRPQHTERNHGWEPRFHD